MDLTPDVTAPPARRRLLFLCNNATYFEAHWSHRATVAAAAGFDVQVGVPNPPESANGEPWSWRLCPMDRRELGLAGNVRAWLETRRLIRDSCPELVVAITVKPNLYASLAIATSSHVPLVLNVTGLGFLFLGRNVVVRAARSLTMSLFRWSGRRVRPWVVFENATDRDLFTAHGASTPERSVLLGGAGVDLGVFTPQPETPTGVPIVILPARLLWDKGIGEFVEAARLLREEEVAARFVLVGDVDAGNPSVIDREVIEGWVRDGVIEWWGQRDDMVDVYRAAHVVCLPSYREGLSRALLEAGASARAVVTTDVAGCRDAIEVGSSGLVVPARDAAALAAALRSVILDPVRRQQLGAAGRRFVEAHFGEDVVATRTIELYSRAIAERAPVRGSHSERHPAASSGKTADECS